MRAILVLLALLCLAAPAAAAVPCDARLCVDVGYPGPGARVVVHQHPDCVVHEVAWEGAWFTFADAAVWAYEGGGEAPWAERPGDAAALLYAWAFEAAVEASVRAPGWAAGDPFGAPLWALERAGDEDVCALGVIEVSSGL